MTCVVYRREKLTNQKRLQKQTNARTVGVTRVETVPLSDSTKSVWSYSRHSLAIATASMARLITTISGVLVGSASCSATLSRTVWRPAKSSSVNESTRQATTLPFSALARSKLAAQQPPSTQPPSIALVPRQTALALRALQARETSATAKNNKTTTSHTDRE